MGYLNDIAWGQSAGAELVTAAFATVFGSKLSSVIIAVGISLFALHRSELVSVRNPLL